MNFVNMLVRMFARHAVFGSGMKMMRKWSKGKKIEALRAEDTSNMTPKEKRRHNNIIARQENQSKMGTSYSVFILLMIIGLLVLYIVTQKK